MLKFNKIRTVASVTAGLSTLVADLRSTAEAQQAEAEYQLALANKADEAAQVAQNEVAKADSIADRIEKLLG